MSPKRDNDAVQSAEAGTQPRSTLVMWRPRVLDTGTEVKASSPRAQSVIDRVIDRNFVEHEAAKCAVAERGAAAPLQQIGANELSERVVRIPSSTPERRSGVASRAARPKPKLNAEIEPQSKRAEKRSDRSRTSGTSSKIPQHSRDGRNAPQQNSPITLIKLFRTHAGQALDSTGQLEKIPTISGTGWGLLTALSTLLGLALVIAYLSQVEQTSLATGILLMHQGPRPVVARATGPVETLLVEPGSVVEQGQVLAHVNASELNARADRAAAQLTQALTEQAQAQGTELKLVRAQRQALESKRALLAKQILLKEQSQRIRHQRSEDLMRAAADGLATAAEQATALDAVRGAEEELLLLHAQQADVQLQLSSLDPNYEAARAKWRHDSSTAASDVAETKLLLETAEVRAPIAGVVESLQITQGQSVAAGDVVARIVPEESAKRLVVFAPVRDASFLRTDLPALIDFASLPVSEFGRATARVVRVARDVSSAEEIAQLVSEVGPGPFIRVELELLPSKELAAVQSRLRSGERVVARITMRKQRLLTMLFEFLRRWGQ